MLKIDHNNIHVVGDTLQSCIVSCILSKSYSTIKHHTTGYLGGINYDEKGYPERAMLPISEDVKKVLIDNGVSDEFVGPFITRYVTVPYEKLKIRNKNNGDILWPFSRESFDPNEWNSIVLGMKNYQEMLDEAEKSRNAPAVLRKRLLTGFYTSVIKRMGVNLFCNPHGQIEPLALIEGILRLDTIYNTSPEPYYIHRRGISEMCKQLLNKNNIKVVVEDISKTRDNIRKRDSLYYISERYDYYMDYVAGGMDYITYRAEKSITNDDMDYMIRYTPYEKHSTKYTHNHVSYESTASVVCSNDGKIPCIQAPTIKTIRAMEEYKEIVKVTPSIRLI